MSFTPITFRHERRSDLIDETGEHTTLPVDLGPVTGTVHYKVKFPPEQLTTAANGGQGPGKETKRRQFVAFKPPFPDIREVNPDTGEEDFLVPAVSPALRVLFVRNEYDWTMQVEVVTP